MSGGCPELEDDLRLIASELATERAWLANRRHCEKVARHETKVAEKQINALLLQAERLERASEECVSPGYGWWW
jgi:hypothetical protein